jgi:hypothetical protein
LQQLLPWLARAGRSRLHPTARSGFSRLVHELRRASANSILADGSEMVKLAETAPADDLPGKLFRLKVVKAP